jgi:hypothetical protein
MTIDRVGMSRPRRAKRDSSGAWWARRSLTAVAASVAVLGTTVAVAGMNLGVSSAAVTPNSVVAGVTTPFNGVWLDSADGGHFWDANSNGLCRIDGTTENAGTCDVQAKKPTQAVVDTRTYSTSIPYFVYAADMSSKSGGPVRLSFDPTADNGAGLMVAGSGTLVGGLNTVGFFSDAGTNFKVSSVALGPCDHSAGSSISGSCEALYLGFERSKMIERINNVDQPVASQSIETISKTTDKRKGVRYGMGVFHNANGTDDLYYDELGGNGVGVITDVASCAPSMGQSAPSVANPTTNALGGCAASIVGAITTSFPQGMAIQNDANGNGQYVYVADSPRNANSTVLRYSPLTGFQDVVTSTVTPYDSLLNPGQTISNYTYILGLGLNPHNGDLYIGDDPTFAVLVNPPLAKGHLFTLTAANGVAPADCAGSATNTCTPPPPPSASTPQLYAYGLTAPKGGVTFVPSKDGGHIWSADHSQGLCRMDVVTAAPALHAFNSAACDDGTVLGSGAQTAYDDWPLPITAGNPSTVGVDGTTALHYLYVAQNDHLSPGVIRFTFDPSADKGAGLLVAGSAVVMAPNAGLNGDKANGLVLGPCVLNADGTLKYPTCHHALYMAGLLDGFVRRINNPEDDPRLQSVDVVAMTTEQRAGTLGKGINGSMGMLGDNLYLPENQGFTVVRNISQCPSAVAAGTQVCATTPLNIGTFGLIFGSAIGTDSDPTHSTAGLVYASISAGNSPATVYQYDVATNTSRIFATQGQMPATGTAAATVWCTTTCTRPADPANPPGGTANFRFAQGIMVDADGNVYMTEDAFAGARGGRGHAWVAGYLPFPAGAGGPAVPLPAPPTVAPTAIQCVATVNLPALAGGTTYWVQVTAHQPGQIAATWKLPVAQSAQLLAYPGNPFAGLGNPVATGPKGKSIALQASSQLANLAITTAPTVEPAGTYTIQYFNAAAAIAATTSTLTWTSDTNTGCPAGPVSVNTIP